MGGLTVAVPHEAAVGERRVALVPDGVRELRAAGLTVLVESGAGAAAFFADDAYAAAGAQIVTAAEAYGRADVVVSVGRPADRLRGGQTVLGLLAATGDPPYLRRLADLGVTAVSFEGLPRRLSRAQPMDALTSQANVSGYKAVLVAANAYGGYFPMLVTAAGTVRPARVLVLGAGVAGLQAMATARRLGAVVSAHDIRPESRDEVTSVGATFLDLTAPPARGRAAGAGEGGPVPDGAGEGGYARALTSGEERAERAALAAHLARHDVVIATALVPGRRPPLLVDEESVKAMAPGSVIVDTACGPLGGNVEVARPDTTLLTDEGVTVIGAGNLAATVPTAASLAYSRNVSALLRHLVRDGALAIDPTDEIQAGVVLTHGGRTVHEGAPS
ncbi:NAD(P) transhydrogenase subunit alpha [Phytohabitans sp. ZYX-F-186]|uniref:proton-translocating NAD(P)(+) transhydrogenase n=1 Tax=Phytohabitans maris TaxID=3071409 RepID=A0ABU0ZT20_9ACTN|nr:NAD(P) transhydrogenase subunit alpha [Phytohabitans sp. ZYX-F-186]MDQ7910181.1 NAD(P) transhydrogenase subunit alpha [Phytohabitans sp. ZYX-F-186]